MRKVCGDFGAELREFNGEDDHVHLPAEGLRCRAGEQPQDSAGRRLRPEFTGRANRYIMHGHFWSPSCFAASCGGAPPSIIRQYIKQQKHPG
jgi:putative transposase